MCRVPLKGLWGIYRDNGKENGSYYLGFSVNLALRMQKTQSLGFRV